MFCTDTRARLAAIRDWLASRDRNAPAFAVDDSLPRSFHTLKGSGRTVGADSIGKLGDAIETLLNRCLDGALSANRAAITVIDDAMQALPGLIAAWRWPRAKAWRCAIWR